MSKTGEPFEISNDFNRMREESKDLYQSFFQDVEQGACVVEVQFDEDDNPVDYIFVEVNSVFEEQTGVVDARGKSVRELLPDLDEFWVQTYGTVAKTGMPRRFEFFAAAMNRWFDVYAFPLGAPNRSWVALLFRDITEYYRIKQKLARVTAESEEHRRLHEAIIASTPELVYVFDLDYRITFANKALLQMWGMSWEEAAGKKLDELGYPDWHVELHEREWDHLVATGEPIRGEVPFSGPLGRRLYDYLMVPLFDAEGEVVAIAGTTRDITDSKVATEMLVEADRRKNRFLAVLSHELRNPLAAIKLSLQLLQLADSGSDADKNARRIIERQTEQLTRLVDDLLEVTRLTQDKIQLQTAIVDVNRLTRETVEDHQPIFMYRDIVLEFTPSEEPIFVEGDPRRLAQVIGNLLQNSAKFTEAGGHTQVKISVDEATEFAEIEVCDDGIGIDPDLLETIFEPFA